MVEEQRGLWFLQHEGVGQAQSASGRSTIFLISGCWPEWYNIAMCKALTCRPLTHITTSLILHQNYYLHESIQAWRKGKKNEKRAARRRRQQERPWWPCPRGIQSSSQSPASATWRRRLRSRSTKIRGGFGGWARHVSIERGVFFSFRVKGMGGLPFAESKREE